MSDSDAEKLVEQVLGDEKEVPSDDEEDSGSEPADFSEFDDDASEDEDGPTLAELMSGAYVSI